MVTPNKLLWIAVGLGLGAAVSAQQQVGTIRGVVFDADFDLPLPGATVTVDETGAQTTSTDQGDFVLRDLRPGSYTLTFSKDGYMRRVRSVEVLPNELAVVDVALPGDFTEMEEFVVEDALQLGAGSEAALLQMRFDSPALMDSISSELMSRAGASDAAAALPLIAGATVKDGKSAVIRGLPDRYVSSQLNGVRLPSADEDKRAVELDQFPAPVIESIQVSKTFTPDQQGDASGGAVDVRLRGVPREPLFFRVSSQIGYNSQAYGRSDFLTYAGGGVSQWGRDDGRRAPQLESLGSSWGGAVGVSETDAPIDYKWSAAGGGRYEFDNGVAIGGLASLFYERDSSFFDDGFDDSYWVENPGDPMTPRQFQGAASGGDFKTQLFDVTRAEQSVQWGTLFAGGLESEHHKVDVVYLYTRTAEDKATLAEDTRGKAYYFPGYDPNNITTPGHAEPDAAPYLRLETLEYTERTTTSLQFSGQHSFDVGDFGPFRNPELHWLYALSSASASQPDKRQFGSLWLPAREVPGLRIEPNHRGFKPGANFTLGNLQRLFREIEEESDQYSASLRLPFEQWTDDEGYLKLGLFRDKVDRTFDQDSYSNFGDNSFFEGPFDRFWSSVFPLENHPISESTQDVDYDGRQEISAFYLMLDMPVASWFEVIGGVRLESTQLAVINFPEPDATWFPPGSLAPTILNPGDADVDFSRDDVLPSVGIVVRPLEQVTLRASYNETVARQTFKEVTPIIQQEFLGGPIFIGNPELDMSSVRNYDLRLDWVPYEGGLVSVSWFRKDLKDPIEYVQRLVSFDFTTAVNYPDGVLSGYELEVRQDLGRLTESLAGFGMGVNTTLIDSEVTLDPVEAAGFRLPEIQAPMETRDMTNAPDYLFNAFVTYDAPVIGTQLGVFYTLQGDTLLAGAAQAEGNFIPNLYAAAYDTLNVSVTQPLGQWVNVRFQARNVTNPRITTLYRSEYIDGDVHRTSFRRGIDYSITLGGEFRF
ncbi:MAG: TonB-dependent receptor [Planctomycetes bacterium]|nr:TonB-dependent receptor [Planctomycetota bacterium]